MRLLSLALVFASATLLAQQAAPKFHGGSDGVTLNVSVFDGDHVVTGLKPGDFEVIDNGVAQAVEAADFNRLPIDLRLVFDTSGSISDDELDGYLRMMQKVAASLDKNDRGEIMTFTTTIAEAAARQHPPLNVHLVRSGPEGTAFFDAAMAAMITVAMPDRRQITILLSDAMDNASFFDEKTLFEAASRTDAVVYTVLPGDPMVGSRWVSRARLGTLSQLTGGTFVVKPPAYIASAITDTIQEFRQSYLVRYSASGVTIPGWHKVSVKVKNHGYKVLTKAGYFGT